MSAEAKEKVRRPVLRWHGGKWRLAPRILPYFPPHRVYVEPFGGAASILVRKERCYAEVYNDLDGDVVNLFRVLRDPAKAALLIAALRLTPFAREEFTAAYEPSGDPVEQARRLVIRSFMGVGSDGLKTSVRTGFRHNTTRAWKIPAHDWINIPDNLETVVARLRGVVIEQKPALEVMAKHDADFALHYVDPPYMLGTRSTKNGYHGYNHELADSDHSELLSFLRGLRGGVVLSGYPAPLYDEALKDWRRVEFAALADGARPRTEVLWINPKAAADLGRTSPQRQLFEAASD